MKKERQLKTRFFVNELSMRVGVCFSFFLYIF